MLYPWISDKRSYVETVTGSGSNSVLLRYPHATSGRCRVIMNTVAVHNVGPAFGLHVRVRVVRVPVRVFVVITDMQTHAGSLDALVPDDEHEAEDGLGAHVQDAVEDGLGIRVQDIATFAKSPGHGIQEPDEEGQHTAAEEDLMNVTAQSLGVLAGRDGEGVDNPEEGGTAEGVVAPLVARAHQSADEAGDDHDFVKEDGVEDCGPWHAGCQE